MKCFRCDKTLESVFGDDTEQPYAATSFYSHGQYGSTVFDPMNSHESLQIHICDECLVKNHGEVKLLTKSTHVTYVSEPWTPESNPE